MINKFSLFITFMILVFNIITVAAQITCETEEDLFFVPSNENKYKRSGEGGIIGIFDTDDDPPAPNFGETPIEDGVLILSIFVGVYAIYKKENEKI